MPAGETEVPRRGVLHGQMGQPRVRRAHVRRSYISWLQGFNCTLAYRRSSIAVTYCGHLASDVKMLLDVLLRLHGSDSDISAPYVQVLRLRRLLLFQGGLPLLLPLVHRRRLLHQPAGTDGGEF